jgi:hypothetical protein
MRLLTALFGLLVVLALASPGNATIIALEANMDCAQANAGAGTCGAGGTGTGTGAISFDDTTNTLSWTISWSGLSAPATLAHFHGPALPNQNAGIQVGIGVASNPAVGAAVISAGQASDLLAGLWYVNIHSSNFPGGEIRGQVTVVPEPAVLGLALLAGLGLALRRTR